jgi:hypothetical protein
MSRVSVTRKLTTASISPHTGGLLHRENVLVSRDIQNIGTIWREDYVEQVVTTISSRLDATSLIASIATDLVLPLPSFAETELLWLEERISTSSSSVIPVLLLVFAYVCRTKAIAMRIKILALLAANE